MTTHQVVSRDEWLKARTALLAKEKAFTRQRDELSAERRALPWVKVEKQYVFEGRDGRLTLADLFGQASQLIVWHFMFHPDWNAGCKSCSFWADNYNPIIDHLRERDVNLTVVSRAPLARLEAFRERMGWGFDWVSSYGSDFNRDFGVTFTADELAQGGGNYNFGSHRFSGEEAPGLSVFYKDADGSIYHTYSCYARGLDMLNTAYQHLDLVPNGRDEKALRYPMEWVRLRDEYGRQDAR
jgi:predicted dithiol-disulfide oxidoreductase (DUF899 family)